MSTKFIIYWNELFDITWHCLNTKINIETSRLSAIKQIAEYIYYLPHCHMKQGCQMSKYPTGYNLTKNIAVWELKLQYGGLKSRIYSVTRQRGLKKFVWSIVNIATETSASTTQGMLTEGKDLVHSTTSLR